VKWGVQHVKVTLENESGETVVIEQSPNGRVKCEPGRSTKSERPANTAPPKATEAKSEKAAAASKPARSKEDKRAEPGAKAEVPAKATEAPKARHAAKSRPKPSRKGALKWVPVKDHDYDGFAAQSGGGQFKALIAKNTQWALFYELKGTWPQHIGCFRKVDKAKERAQELHDAGWPETEFRPITAGQIARACPAPRRQDEVDEEMATTPKTEEKPAEPQPEPKGEDKTDAERDKELMGSFSGEMDRVLDEDEDD
jgi:hypothetical protein